jgi:hypothetical protein
VVLLADKGVTPVYALGYYENSSTIAGATPVQASDAITFLVYPA